MNRSMLLLLCGCFIFGASAEGMIKTAPPKNIPLQAKNIGVRSLLYTDTQRERPVWVEFWYPTESDGPFEAVSDPIWIHPAQMRGAPISAKKKQYPLILMSHGHKGDRRDRSWLAEYLVRRGFVVASVEHYGNTKSSFNPVLTLRFWDRVRDVSFVIDQILADDSIRQSLDKTRIGFIGYSLGGMTGLSLAGAIAENVKEIAVLEQKKHKDIQLEVLDQVDFSEAYKDYRDPRIQAMLLICPATFVFPSHSLEKVKMPIGLVATIHDEVLQYKEHAQRIIKYIVPSQLKVLDRNVSHFAFLNRITEAGKEWFAKGNHSMGEQDSVHSEVGRFAADFFSTHL